MQFCSSLSILWHCLSLGLEWKLTFSSPVATVKFPKFAGILPEALAQPHLIEEHWYREKGDLHSWPLFSHLTFSMGGEWCALLQEHAWLKWKNLLYLKTILIRAISNPKRWYCENAALNMPATLKNSAVATELEKFSFYSNPKERQCQRMLRLPHNCTHLTH